MKGFRLSFLVVLGHMMSEDPPQLDGDVFVDRAGMRLLLLHAQLR
jgi:hypothetical protein